MRTSAYDTKVRFERPVRGAGLRSAGKGTWVPVAIEWANVQDVLPSRTEKLDEGLSIETRPARIRLRFRQGLDATMRIVIGSLDQPDDPPPADRRVMQIKAGPATVGRRSEIEFMAADYSLEGGSA